MDNSRKKQWTVMFYFASDNPLAPGVVSQLKAIKQAGFHPDANVIAQFDPQTAGTPTHVFDVNLLNKLKSHGAPNIGFDANDPFVRNLLEDKLWRDQKTRDGKLLRGELKDVLEKILTDIDYDPPVPPDDRGMTVSARASRSRKELPPKQSLENFLTFCVNRYPAWHYMLFILGHGVVVGNDIFLFDEHVSDRNNTLSLVELGEVLSNFAQEVNHQRSEFELVGFHSCSVSSLEIAYELGGTAKYMLASQGPAFVGSWPYRQILIRLFNDLVDYGGRIDVEKMLLKIFSYCLYNSSDFLLAGYSYDLSLCNLNNVLKVKDPLMAFSDMLSKCLKISPVRNLILLAHLKSQSFWQESYTDLYDFCFCLKGLCEEYLALNQMPDELKELLEKTQGACCELIRHLDKKDGPNDKDKIVIDAAFAGPAYQYSHGLSVFFPWARPSEDSQILAEYKNYKFDETRWLKFLEDYFDQTIRKTREDEKAEEKARLAKDNPPQQEATVQAAQESSEDDKQFQRLLEDIASLVYIDEGQLSGAYSLAGPKTDPTDRTGDASTGSSIKNYPHDTRPGVERGTQASDSNQAVPISRSLSRAVRQLVK